MSTHAASLAEAIATAKPIPGTRYSLGSFLPTVGLSARPRPIYVLTVDGVEVDRGSKADLMQCAKSPAGSPLGACHARYDATLTRQQPVSNQQPEQRLVWVATITNEEQPYAAPAVYVSDTRDGLLRVVRLQNAAPDDAEDFQDLVEWFTDERGDTLNINSHYVEQ